MNPFKEKSLDTFTIADCELYISRYPYGEHILEVKAHLRKLKSALVKDLSAEPQEQVTNVMSIQQNSQEKNIAKVERSEGGTVAEDNSNVGNMIVRILLSIGLVVIIIALIPTIIGAPISIMIAKPAFEAIWKGDCDIF